ncbi:hypothetical protein MUB24_13210 [Lederbergia sp. NSJ-179]|uniref:hypothetical protein n=1 Tax=Lederbergia sp. NSJ-179 TaxID=2931402 RepID=UPI001FD574CC|nr:hypothetical protein [Lederbergia sp. NSJ-179]MCJ7841840.1 hypothetical protein [Lederbergia sp. NSJ-179]
MEQFILFIIIALVGLFFNRGKLKNQQQQQEHPRPVQRPVQMNEEAHEKPASFEQMTQAKSLKEAADQLKNQPDIYKQKEEMEVKLKELYRNEELHRKKAKTIQTKTNAHKERLPEFQVKKENILNGMIMSEVLGPPRAKKPYQRRKI